MTSPSAPRTSGFRDDIQGMRALAVLTVIAAHAGLSFLPGGYVGVDVFFVISGFLITQLLVREAARSGRLSLVGFYARRARRILPAAGVVLVCTLLASLIWMSVLEAIDLAKDALWSAAFAANVHFAQEGVDYFAAEEAPSPVQHYWSLAVEEQFYLVWPLLVALCFWWASRRGHDRAAAVRALVGLILALGAASLVWSVLHTGDEPESAYFSSLTRAWELAVGAGVALAVHAGRTLRHRLASEVLAWAGLAAIAVACLTYDETTPFPGTAALLPVLGAGAVLWAGASRTEVTTSAAKLLSLAPLRHVGDWSYSLYLWHWPLLVVPATVLDRDLSVRGTLLAVAATFLLSYLTFRVVETPFRSGKVWSHPRRTLVLYPVFLGVVAATAGAGWAWSDYRVSEQGDDPAITTEQFGIKGHGPEALVRASVLAARADLPLPSDLSPDLVDLEKDIADVECLYDDDATLELCPQGADDGTKTLVVIGDSHARAWVPAIEEIAEHAGYRAYYLVKPQCTALPVNVSSWFTYEPWPECQEFHDWTEEQLRALRPDLLVMASTPFKGFFDESGALVNDRAAIEAESERGLEQMFNTYQPLAERMVLLSDVPRLQVDPAACLSKPGTRMADCTLPPEAFNLHMRKVTAAVADREGIEIVDPAAWMCTDDLCPLVVGATIAYRDRGHISSTRALELAQPLGRALGLWKR
jgi:peptidoglycan/LPS O-acetylase OafA/YrhL